jgi:ParB family transcriptional regulator, chromosome partitioning protein
MANKKALGRGLSALIPDIPAAEKQSKPVQFIEVMKVAPNPFQPRETFRPEALAELKQSIAEKGLVQPITVRRYGAGYQLIAGERRLRAVRDLGLEAIPAYILDVASDEDMLELAIIENIHREDLNPLEVAHSYKRLMEECNLTQEEVAVKVSRDRASVANFLRLIKLPRKIQESLQDGDLSMGHARALLSLESAEQQVQVWQKILKSALSVRQVENLVRSQTKKVKPRAKGASAQTAYISDLENKLRTHLATKVSIKARKKGGVIEIDYYSDDELDRLSGLLAGE